MNFVCSICGNRQADASACQQCGEDGLLDLREEQTLSFLQEVEDRHLQKRQDRARWLSVGVAMVAVVALWFVPGFWALRRHGFALPFLLDQWMLMGLIGVGMNITLDKKLARTRQFPFLEHGKLIA